MCSFEFKTWSEVQEHQIFDPETGLVRFIKSEKDYNEVYEVQVDEEIKNDDD